MQVMLFVKDNCPRCPAAKHACEGIEGIEMYDIGEVDGLAEAAYHGVLATPTILVVDSSGNEVASWRGEAPDRASLHAVLSQ